MRKNVTAISELTILQVDAFTDKPLTGNPCAVVLDADVLSIEQMQAIALEMNLSETAFVVSSSKADYGARYFTPAEEIPLAGHPTIATTIALIEAGRLAVSDRPTSFSLELKAGVVRVHVERTSDGDLIVTMNQLKPRFMRTYPVEQIAPVFGLVPGDLMPDAPVQTVSTGTPMLMVPLCALGPLRRAQLDLKLYEQARSAGDFFSPHLFCLEGVTDVGDTFARHFGVPPDTPEDPFTGSATGCMGAYLWRYNLIAKPRLVAEQGHWMNRPGAARVEVLGSRDDIESVLVGGSGVTVLRGALTI